MIASAEVLVLIVQCCPGADDCGLGNLLDHGAEATSSKSDGGGAFKNSLVLVSTMFCSLSLDTNKKVQG